MGDLLNAQPLTLALVALVLILGGDKVLKGVGRFTKGVEVPAEGVVQAQVELFGMVNSRLAELHKALNDYTNNIEKIAKLESDMNGLQGRDVRIEAEILRVRERLDKIEEVGDMTVNLLRSIETR